MGFSGTSTFSLSPYFVFFKCFNSYILPFLMPNGFSLLMNIIGFLLFRFLAFSGGLVMLGGTLFLMSVPINGIGKTVATVLARVFFWSHCPLFFLSGDDLRSKYSSAWFSENGCSLLYFPHVMRWAIYDYIQLFVFPCSLQMHFLNVAGKAISSIEFFLAR